MAVETRIRKAWTAATSERKRDVTIRPQSVTHQALQQVMALDGSWNCCDFWIDVQYDDDPLPGKVAGWSTVVLSLWAKNGFIETMLDSKLVSEHEGILIPQRATRRRVQAILLSARGRPCDGFIVQAQPYEELSVPLSEYARAKAVLECWGEDSTNPNDWQGRTIVDPYAPRDQWWDTNHIYLNGASGPTSVIAASAIWPDSDRRNFITSVSCSTTDAAIRRITLQSRARGGAWVDRWTGAVSDVSPIEMTFPTALSGPPGGDWQWVLSGLALATDFHVNVTGFIQ